MSTYDWVPVCKGLLVPSDMYITALAIMGDKAVCEFIGFIRDMGRLGVKGIEVMYV